MLGLFPSRQWKLVEKGKRNGTREWNKGMEQGNGTREWNKGMEQGNGTREWNKGMEQGNGTREWKMNPVGMGRGESSLNWIVWELLLG